MDLNKTLMCFIVTKILHYFWKSNYVAANDRYFKLMFYFVGKNCFCGMGVWAMALHQQSDSMAKKITIFLFEWRSALGMRRVALASAESNAAPSEAKPAAARPAGKRPKESMPYYRTF